ASLLLEMVIVGVVVAGDGRHRHHYADIKVALECLGGLWCVCQYGFRRLVALFRYVTEVFVGRSLVLSFMALCESRRLVVSHRRIVSFVGVFLSF
ncbi:11254_t:CDS:2, partial [Gigaspora margarita]